MRTLLASALLLVACGRSDRPADPATQDASLSPVASAGPDAIVLRIPRAGGTARAYLYPRLDSAVWSAPGAPAAARALGFDSDAGSLVYVDGKGVPVRLGLRSGVASATRRPKLVATASEDGSAIYGVTDSGAVARITPTGRWTLVTPARARDVLPQADGSLIVAGERGKDAMLWHLWPPETRIVDSVRVPGMARARRLQAGDRLVLVGDSSVTAVRGRDLVAGRVVELDGATGPAAATPSGDRVYVALRGTRELHVVPRDAEDDVETIELPGEISELRMDPLGRYLLARPTSGDSAWVISLGTQKVLGAVATQWRVDLPLVAPDGRLLLVSGNDVRIVHAETLAPGGTVRGAARDFWYIASWNGFRPRDSRLDEPVRFATGDSALVDSAAASGPDSADPSGAFSGALPQGDPQPPAPGATPAATRAPAWYVSLASHGSEDVARAEAERIVVAGVSASVQRGEASGRVVYRVVVGPYPTRSDAERAGTASGRSYWIFSGTQ